MILKKCNSVIENSDSSNEIQNQILKFFFNMSNKKEKKSAQNHYENFLETPAYLESSFYLRGS